MAINHNIEWDIRNSGFPKAGAGFNKSNQNLGQNYSYGPDYKIIQIQDLTLNQADNYKPGIPSWTLSDGGTFPAGTYYVGIRYVALGGDGEIVAKSELVEFADYVPPGKTLVINSPASIGYPFDHYQVFIRELSGSNTYAQLQNYGGGEVASSIGVNLQLSSFSTLFESFPVSTLPNKGNIYELSSATRNFIANDIGNFIYIENNNFGFRSESASEVSNTTVTELGKTSSELLAAWFDVDETTNVNQISVVMWAVGSPSGDLILELRSNNSGVPSGTILDSGGINASTLSSSPQWVDVAVNSNLSPGRYWIVINFNGGPDSSNYLKVGRKISTGFQNLNQNHLFQYNSGTMTWSNVDNGIAVAIGVISNTNFTWGNGDYSEFIKNKGSLRLEILNVKSNKALICSSFYVSNLNSSGGVGYLGGATNQISELNEHCTIFGYHSLAHIKSDNYVINEPLVLTEMSISGYENLINDLKNKPVFIVNDNLNPLLYDYDTGLGVLHIAGNGLQIINIEIDANNFAEKILTATNKSMFIWNCWFHNSAHSGLVFGNGDSQIIWIESTRISDFSTAYQNSACIHAESANHLSINNCYFDNIAGCGIFANELSLKVEFCIFHDLFGPFTNNGHAIIGEKCTDVKLAFLTINGCSKDGVILRQTSNLIICNSLFTNNGSNAISLNLDTPLGFKLNKIFNNAYYNNSGNQLEVNFLSIISQMNSITLTQSPYTYIGNDYVDFTLNAVTGSGELLIGRAYPQVFPGLISKHRLDIGAVQTYGNQPVPRRNPTIYLY